MNYSVITTYIRVSSSSRLTAHILGLDIISLFRKTSECVKHGHVHEASEKKIVLNLTYSNLLQQSNRFCPFFITMPHIVKQGVLWLRTPRICFDFHFEQTLV